MKAAHEFQSLPVMPETSLKPMPDMPHYRHPILAAFKKTEYGRLLLVTPEGRALSFAGAKDGPQAHLKLHRWEGIDALLSRGETGFAEAYVKGLWETEDLPALLTFGLANAQALERYFYGKPLYALWVKARALLHRNSPGGSRRNILKHYDLGNDFYALWLDKSMTYSGAFFGGDASRSLEEAQAAKYDRILGKLNAQAGAHILEIGCGWGGFAEAAARRGLRTTSITISRAQHEYADARIRAAGLENLADIQLRDYRESKGQFDHIVSIGMFEHVGRAYWPTYFRAVKSHLKPAGTAMIQSITIDEEVFERVGDERGFIEEYIFPGGMLPTKTIFAAEAQKAGLACRELFAFGRDYAITTRKWLERFEAQREKVLALGFDEHFIRQWRFYLSSCIAAFTTGRTDLIQAELRHAA